MTSWEDVIEELPTEVRAELFPVDAPMQERTSLLEEALGPSEALRACCAWMNPSCGRNCGADGADFFGNAGGPLRPGNRGNGTPITWEAIFEGPVVIIQRTSG